MPEEADVLDERTADDLAAWVGSAETQSNRLRTRVKRITRHTRYGDEYGVECYVDGRRVWTITGVTRKAV